MNLKPSKLDGNTASPQQSEIYMKLQAELNPLLKQPKEMWFYGGKNNNWDLITKGISPNEFYFDKMNFYLDQIINYFLETIDVESNSIGGEKKGKSKTNLNYRQWTSAGIMLYNLFYFGKVFVSYDSDNECYQTYLVSKSVINSAGLFESGEGIPIGAINSTFGYVKNPLGYKVVKLSGEKVALGQLTKWGLGFYQMLRIDILKTIYFENKVDNVAILETVKGYEKMDDETKEGYFENQIKNEDQIVIKKKNIVGTDISNKLEILDYKAGEKISSLTGFIDWRDARLSTWIGIKEMLTKNKKSNLLVGEIEGVKDKQDKRLEAYYDVARRLFMRLKELYPDSPIELKPFQEVGQEEPPEKKKPNDDVMIDRGGFS